jgi:hypothetical protein
METLVVVEILGRSGEVLRRDHLCSLPATIGRGFDANIQLDDPHVAAHHLRLDAGVDDELVLTDLETHNGFEVPARSSPRVEESTVINVGETIRLGHTQIRIWRPDSEVSAEVPIRTTTNARNWVSSLTWMVLALVLVGLPSWIDLTGPHRDSVISFALMISTVGLLLWSGLWWLSSRSTLLASSYLSHLAIAASTLSIAFLGYMATNTATFSFDLYYPGLSHASVIVVGVLLALGVYRHLRLVSRKSRIALGIIAIAAVTAILVPIIYSSKQDDLEKVGLLDIPTNLGPPWIRVAAGITPVDFVNQSLTNRVSSDEKQ